MAINPIITAALSTVVSGIFLGLGIAIGFYYSLKKLMPAWIHEIINEMRKTKAIENALETRKTYWIRK